jgi:NADPH:quinone reductase-like Zn-dependent oxidoreductase
MRAAILREYGATPELGDFEDPSDRDGAVAAGVLAAGLNPVDLRKAAGAFPLAPTPPLPCVAGWEGVARLPDGSRAYFSDPVAPHGALAERTLVDPARTFAVPDGVDDAVAVALGIAGLAGWLALEWSGKLQQGETVLVLGASGTVGLVAVQAAKLLGAARVVAAARSEAGLARAAELGADATVRITETGDALTDALKEAGGGGYDLIVDPLWGEPAVAAARALHRFGRLVALGQSAGAEATLASADVRNRAISIVGHTNYAISEDDRRAAYGRMAAHAAAGELTADTETLPLERAPEAWERLRSGPGTKLVVSP